MTTKTENNNVEKKVDMEELIQKGKKGALSSSDIDIRLDSKNVFAVDKMAILIESIISLLAGFLFILDFSVPKLDVGKLLHRKREEVNV